MNYWTTAADGNIQLRVAHIHQAATSADGPLQQGRHIDLPKAGTADGEIANLDRISICHDGAGTGNRKT